jgi:hypothetical protein
MSDPKTKQEPETKQEPKTREAKTIVKLIHHYQSNNAGEVCGFPPEVAAQLIERKHAVAHPLKK